MIRSARAVVPPTAEGERLDRALAGALGWTRGQARRAIELGGVYLDRARVRVASRPVRAGQAIEAWWSEPPEPAVPPLAPAAVLLRRDGLLALDKPSGVHCQAARHRVAGTLPVLARALLGLREAPEPLHRLDRDCSGLVVLGEGAAARSALARLWREGRVRKRYLALASGEPEVDARVIAAPLGPDPAGPDGRQRVDDAGLAAETRLRVRGRGAGVALLELEPVSGRTHQLRVHCAHVGLPLLGDPWYAPPEVAARAPRLCLHAWRLALPPGAPGTPCDLVAPIPPDILATASAWGLDLPAEPDWP